MARTKSPADETYSWYIDDLPPMMFIKNSPNSHGYVNPRDVEQIWMDHFDYYYREFDEFIFPMTIHPGRQSIATRLGLYILRRYTQMSVAGPMSS